MSFTFNNKRKSESEPKDTVAAALPAVASLMAGNQKPSEFVPTLGVFPRTTNFQSIGSDDGCAQVLKMRRPPSQHLTQFLTELVTSLVATGEPVGDLFRNGDAGIVEELFDMYDRVGTEPPTSLKTRLCKLGSLSGSLTGSAYTPKQEIQVSIVPLVSTLQVAQRVDRRCKKLFGVGASTLAIPLTFVIGTLSQLDVHVKHLLECSKNENPVVAPGLKSPPLVDRKVAARPCLTSAVAAAVGVSDKMYKSPRALVFCPPPAYTPPETVAPARPPTPLGWAPSFHASKFVGGCGVQRLVVGALNNRQDHFVSFHFVLPLRPATHVI